MSIYKTLELPKNAEGKFTISKEAIAAMKKAKRISIEKSAYDSKGKYDYDVNITCTYQAKVEGEDEKVDVRTSFVVNGYWNNPKEFSSSFYDEKLFFPELLKEGMEMTIKVNRTGVWYNDRRHEELVTDDLILCLNLDTKNAKEILLDVRTGSRFDYGLIGRKEERPAIAIIEPLQLQNGE